MSKGSVSVRKFPCGMLEIPLINNGILMVRFEDIIAIELTSSEEEPVAGKHPAPQECYVVRVREIGHGYWVSLDTGRGLLLRATKKHGVKKRK